MVPILMILGVIAYTVYYIYISDLNTRRAKCKEMDKIELNGECVCDNSQGYYSIRLESEQMRSYDDKNKKFGGRFLTHTDGTPSNMRCNKCNNPKQIVVNNKYYKYCPSEGYRQY